MRDSGSTITIPGGTVTASGSSGGMGIGGYGSEEPFVNISGGTVTAKSAGGSAGIGGRASGNGGVINISGGTVFAQGSSGGPGIGGIFTGSSGTITISGGTVYAGGDPAAANDIGAGIASTTGTLTISGTARVFLQNDSCITPATTHTHETYPAGTGEVYDTAVSVPDSWTVGFGAWLNLCGITYDINGGSGTAPAGQTQLYGKEITLPDGSGMSNSGYVFGGWNTAADGSGTGYDAGAAVTFTADTELFAQWTQLTLESTVTGGASIGATVYTGGRFTLTPNVDGGTWDWDEEYFSATFNSPATFTALKAGTSIITYTVDGVSTTYGVTIEQSGLPATGQGFAWVWALCGAALMALVAASFTLRKCSRKIRP